MPSCERVFLSVFSVAAMLLATGCAGSLKRTTVRIPELDPTPPLTVLDVVGRDTTLVLKVGGEPEAVELAPDDSLVLIAKGEDLDGGVKDFTLSGNARITCKDPATGKSNSRSIGFLRRTIMGSPPRHRGPVRKSSRFVLRPGDFAALCPGKNVESAVGQASARTVNFNGGHAISARLEFRLSAAVLALAKAGPAVTFRIPVKSGCTRAMAALSCPARGVSGRATGDRLSAAGSVRTEGPEPAGSVRTEGPEPLCSDGAHGAGGSSHMGGSGDPVPFMSPAAVPTDTPALPAARSKT